LRDEKKTEKSDFVCLLNNQTKAADNTPLFFIRSGVFCQEKNKIKKSTFVDI
jgi:hypothetical protein